MCACMLKLEHKGNLTCTVATVISYVYSGLAVRVRNTQNVEISRDLGAISHDLDFICTHAAEVCPPHEHK